MRAVRLQRCTCAPRARFASAAGAYRPAYAKPTEKIAKRLSRSGLCSRRVGEEWILAGRVSIDGKVVRDPATRIISTQKVTVDGAEAKVGAMRLWIHNKKPGVTVTERDAHAVIPLIPTLQSIGLPRLQPIGRLDINSEGLLLLYRFVYIVVLYHRTNDGELKQALERSSLKRKYRVRLRGAIPATMADDLRQGVQVDGIQYAPIEMTLTRPDSMQNQWVDITLQEGKNREIRKIMQHYGLQTSRLIRTQFGPYTLDGLEAGATREAELKSTIRRWVKKLREGKLDLRSLDQLNKEKKDENNDEDDEE